LSRPGILQDSAAGDRRKGDAYFVASETVGFDIIDAQYVRDVRPGEMVIIDSHTQQTGEIRSMMISEEAAHPHHWRI